MTEPTSWQLLEWVKARVALIKTSEGFRTDIGLGVIALDDDQIPEDIAGAATIIEATDISPGQSTTSESEEITIEFAVPRDADVPNAKLLAHRGRADILQVLRVKGQDLPRYVTGFTVTGTRLIYAAEESSGARFVIAQVTARAGLVEIP